jgi:deoxycytidylate deaminase
MTVTKKKIQNRATPNRDEKYMGAAFIEASYSKDPDTQHGAVIVTVENIPLGRGYNGPPRQYNDNDVDWSRPAKYHNMVHAEINAMNHSDPHLLEGATMYVTGKPCSACMLAIVARGIQKVVYFPRTSSDPNSMMNNTAIFADTDDIAKKGKVTLEPFKGNLNWMNDWMSELEKLGIFDCS